MKIRETTIEGCWVLEPREFVDERGSFYESFNQRDFVENTGIDAHFVQDNHSYSKKNVLRGLHYQTGQFAQAKLVRVVLGKVLDVVVDLRKGSKSFLKVFKQELSSVNGLQVFVPKGCAHGFLVLEGPAIFLYKCDKYYHPHAETGIRFNDPKLDIDWGIPTKDLILSKKDGNLPFLSDQMINQLQDYE